MTETIIYLDNGESISTKMPYSDVINLLTHINQSTAFVEFPNMNGRKQAVSPAHVVEVLEYRA